MTVIASAFAPLLGLPCWGVSRIQGSLLSFEFGQPHLVVREPYKSSSPHEKVRASAARRSVKPVGEWNFLVFSGHWRIADFDNALADSDGSSDRIELAVRKLNGQKLTAFSLDASTRAATLSFDLGGSLTAWPYEADEEEQWSLYMPGDRVLTYRADGLFSLGRSDEKPGSEVWRPATENPDLP